MLQMLRIVATIRVGENHETGNARMEVTQGDTQLGQTLGRRLLPVAPKNSADFA